MRAAALISLSDGGLTEFLFADRGALTRELAKMRDEGIIDCDRNCFQCM